MQAVVDDLALDPRFDPLATLDGGDVQHRWAGDAKLHIKFYTKPVVNPTKSTLAGRAIFDEQDYIVIHTPGSQLTVIDSPVIGTNYEQRFAAQYKAWKDKQTVSLSGTPLEAFPFLAGKIGLTAELKAMNIHTVEQLASVSDGHMSGFMGGFELRKRAAEWLEATTGTDAQVANLAKENADLKFRLDMLEASQKAPPPVPARKP